MFRYMAFAWHALDETGSKHAQYLAQRLRETDPRWRVVYAESGICVLCIGNRGTELCTLIQDHGGVILGNIFGRIDAEAPGSSSEHASLDSAQSARIVKTLGRALIDDYWGSYVAIINDRRTAVCRILRSPAGTLPCLSATSETVRLYFSYLPDCLSLNAIRTSVNWKYVSRYLLKLTGNTETGLNEVTELSAGYCATIGSPCTAAEVYWDPRSIALREPITDVKAATSMVRNTTIACVGAWSSSHRSVLHRLSGGLDSSIVLACLKQPPAHAAVTCMTHYSAGSNSDERDFARLAATSAGCDIIEFHRESAVDLSRSLRAEASDVPQRYIPRLSLSDFERGIALRAGATAIFSGNGGDEVFSTQSSFAAADYVWHHGIDSGLFRTLLHNAEMDGTSIWSGLWDALRKGIFPPEWDPLRAAQPRHHILLSDEFIASMRMESHRNSRLRNGTVKRLPIGKQHQIYGMLLPEPYYLPFSEPGDPEPIAPLKSQPLIEACLRIPTYVLSHGGWNRAIARSAFAIDLPQQILHRRSKGGAGNLGVRILLKNIDFVRDLLLNGALVGNRFLDKQRLEQALSTGPTSTLKSSPTIFRYLTAEIWLQILDSRAKATAA